MHSWNKDGPPEYLYVIKWQDRIDPSAEGYIGLGGSSIEYNNFTPFLSYRDALEYIATSSLEVRQKCEIISWRLESHGGKP